MPCYGYNNDGIMPFTRRLCAGFKNIKNKKLKSNEKIITKRKSRSAVG